MALLTMHELAAELGVHPNTVWTDYKRGGIPGERIGRLLRFDLQQVRKVMRRRARKEQQAAVAGQGARIGGSRPRGETPHATNSQSGPRRGKCSQGATAKRQGKSPKTASSRPCAQILKTTTKAVPGRR